MLRSKRVMTLFGGLAVLCVVVASAHATHPRPKGASPMRLSLVPAYTACSAPNRTHGPPLSFPSCNPPAQTSGQATVGTPDAFGGPANLVSYFRVTAIVGTPGLPDDSAMRLELVLDDMRCVPSGARCGAPNASGPPDYTGEVAIAFTVRLTDHFNGVGPGGGGDPATVQDTSFELTWPVVCGETASTAIGSSCTGSSGFYTSLNFFIPGAAVQDGKRAIYEFDDVQIYDGGADGDADTTADNTVFLRPGVFIP